MSRRSLTSVFVFISIIIASVLIIFFARGYRVNLGTKDLKSTGLLVATSFPDGASVYVDGKLKTATNNTINLSPGEYNVKITKEGYIPWEKKLKVQGEIVTKTDAQLFPSTPDLRPLTSLGVIDPTLSPDGNKIAYFVKNSETPANISKDGIWILNIAERVLPLNPQSLQITRSNNSLNWSESKLYWSPDSKEIIAVFPKEYFLLSTEEFNTTPKNITNSINTTLGAWKEEKQLKEKRIIESLPLDFQNIASTSATNISLSPDETKIMYIAAKEAAIPEIIKPPLLGTNSQAETRNIKPGNTYVYDIKEDKNFEVFKAKPETTPKPVKPTPSPKTKSATPSPEVTNGKPLTFWLASSRHLVFVENNTVYAMEYDSANKQAIYGGPFENSYLFPHQSGSKLIILTNYNKTSGSTPNLYAINLK